MHRHRPTVTRTWLNGREFRSIRFPAERESPHPVIVTWAVWEVRNSGVFRGTFISRHRHIAEIWHSYGGIPTS